MNVNCLVTHQSAAMPGVEFDIRRMSFGRRLELMTKVRALSQRREFHEAGERPDDRMESAMLSMQIDQIYLEWGFEQMRGLTLDGEDVTAQTLWCRGPETLTREVIEAIRREAGLSEDERKN